MRATTGLTALTIIFTTAMTTAATADRAECDCWRFVRPTGLTADSALGEVTAPAYTAAWATGSRGSRPVLMAWNGHEWRDAPLDIPRDTLLEGVSAASRDDVWIVGFDPHGTPLAVHGNGRTWRPAPFPKLGPSFPRAVDARTTQDVWSVGSTSGFAGTQAAAWHWDGSTWKSVPVQSPLGSAFAAVSASSADEAWAVGDHGRQPLIMRWDGTAWTDSPIPKIDGEATLTDVADDWAVGASFVDGKEKPLALHWNGTAWTDSPIPGTGRLASVAPDGKDGVWAAGRTAEGRATMAHWDGHTWDLSTPPSPQGKEGETRTAPSSVWALAHVPGSPYLWATGTTKNTALTWTNAPRPR
jgi:hypothetical protein